MRFVNIGCMLLVGSSSFKHGIRVNNRYLNSKSNSRLNIDMKKEKKPSFRSIYMPKNENQQLYMECLDNPKTNIIVSVGPAGTGKTMFGCIKAINELQNGNINKIIITRPLVTVEEELGFLPGDILKKMDPWTRPIFDIFLEHITKNELNSMLYNNIIEISPLAFMRGRTFKNAFIIADEMQNSSPNQMKMLTSRMGENTKMVITGDLKQTDRQIDKNGLYDFITRYNGYNKRACLMNETDDSIKIIEFKTEDIERSEIVKKVIDIYNYDVKDDLSVSKKPEMDSALIPLADMQRVMSKEMISRKPRKIWEEGDLL